MRDVGRFHSLARVWIAFSLAIAIAAMATHVLGQKMLESMVPLLAAFVTP